jgi:hypothetical protein
LIRVKVFFGRFENYFERCKVKADYAAVPDVYSGKGMSHDTRRKIVDGKVLDPHLLRINRRKIGERVRKALLKKAEPQVMVNGELLPLVKDGEKIARRRKRGEFTQAEDETILFAYAISSRIVQIGRSGFWVPIAKLFDGAAKALDKEAIRRRFNVIIKLFQNQSRLQHLTESFEILYERALITKELDSMEDSPSI